MNEAFVRVEALFIADMINSPNFVLSQSVYRFTVFPHRQSDVNDIRQKTSWCAVFDSWLAGTDDIPASFETFVN
jgi:hypothetical protein